MKTLLMVVDAKYFIDLYRLRIVKDETKQFLNNICNENFFRLII